MITFDHVMLGVAGKRIIDDLNCTLDLEATPRVAVIGDNGSGKSTFLRLIDGLAKPTSGHIGVLGLDPVRQAKQVHRRIGFVFTDPDTQIIMPTVREDVAFSLRGMGLPRQETDRRVDRQLEHFGLAAHASTPAHSLSGGQKQLLALASILVRDPDLVLADEPTTMLDLPNARRIERLLLEGIGRPMIVATHDLRLAAQCDLALRFRAGRIVESGDADEVIGRYVADCEAADDAGGRA